MDCAGVTSAESVHNIFHSWVIVSEKHSAWRQNQIAKVPVCIKQWLKMSSSTKAALASLTLSASVLHATVGYRPHFPIHHWFTLFSLLTLLLPVVPMMLEVNNDKSFLQSVSLIVSNTWWTKTFLSTYFLIWKRCKWVIPRCTLS